MRIANTIAELRQLVQTWRQIGKTVALVPTMGNLHEGHLRLLEVAKQQAERVVVSIFVNPTQFGAGEDYASYPRTEAEDFAVLRAAHADALFVPTEMEMYPPGNVTSINLAGLADIHCGAFRTGHFSAVATVVCKLFNIAQPDIAMFGEKDYQQLAVIRRMVQDLNMPVEIVGVATVREADGLAMSSRNSYMDVAQRAIAPALYSTLCEARALLLAGESNWRALEEQQMRRLQHEGLHPEYFAICRSDDLLPAAQGDDELVILAAARLGKARLIDNVRFSIGKPIAAV